MIESILIGLVIVAALAVIAWQERQHTKQLELMERTTREYRIEHAKLVDQYIHHITTARKEGVTFQPQDEQWEPWRITAAQEAELEDTGGLE